MYEKQGRREVGGAVNWVTRIDMTMDTMYTLPCRQEATNGSLLYSTRNSTQGSVVTYMGRKPKERGGVFTLKALPLLYSRDTHDVVQQRSSTMFQVL